MITAVATQCIEMWRIRGDVKEVRQSGARPQIRVVFHTVRPSSFC